VRFLFERGHVDRAYVWDSEQQEHLLGYSRRGVDAQLRFYPVAGGGFASWDRMTAASKPLRFDHGEDGQLGLKLNDGDQTVRGHRP
jgi:hypothetical protein